jgi:sulfur carrier protein
MQIVVNGTPKDIPEGTTVSGLLHLLAVDASKVAVEVDDAVVPKAKHAQTALHLNATVEIVTFVGGG